MTGWRWNTISMGLERPMDEEGRGEIEGGGGGGRGNLKDTIVCGYLIQRN